MGFIKGASPKWWRNMHNRHHAKPNVAGKDPDTGYEHVLLLGEKQVLQVYHIEI
jgi:fatty acid desaturase